MANTKEYKIVINGISEAINAVDSLNKKLESLEQRISAVNSKKVSSGGGSTSSARANTGALNEEAKLEKQIEQTEAKREAYSKEIYQNYLAAKEALNDTVKDQKQIAASERLQANNYSNTIRGMKQELADIKEVMQTVDLGDTAEFDRLTQRANELNEALKKIEATYGQFGRQVGNYKSAFDSFQGIAVTIGGVTKSFDNLKQATKAIRDEMGKLEYNNQQDTQ
jgi:chromosome segregation ATPase